MYSPLTDQRLPIGTSISTFGIKAILNNRFVFSAKSGRFVFPGNLERLMFLSVVPLVNCGIRCDSFLGCRILYGQLWEVLAGCPALSMPHKWWHCADNATDGHECSGKECRYTVFLVMLYIVRSFYSNQLFAALPSCMEASCRL